MAGSQELLIRSLLQKGHEEMATRVMNECVILPHSLRQEILERAVRLAESEPKRGLPTLLSINTGHAAGKFFGLCRRFNICSSEETLQIAKSAAVQMNDKRWDVLKLARSTALRCHYNYSLTIYHQWETQRAVGYESEFD